MNRTQIRKSIKHILSLSRSSAALKSSWTFLHPDKNSCTSGKAIVFTAKINPVDELADT